MAAGRAGHSLRSRFDFSWAARPCYSLYLRTALDCVHSPARNPGLRETPRGRRESFGRHRSAQSAGARADRRSAIFLRRSSRSIWTECYCKFSLNNLRREEHLSPCYAATAHRRKARRAGIHPFDKLLDNCGAPWPSQQILRQRVWKQTGDSLLWSSAAQLHRQLIRRARTGWADQDPEKPSTASACSSNSTLCSIPAPGPTVNHQASSPLAAHHSAVSFFSPCCSLLGLLASFSCHPHTASSLLPQHVLLPHRQHHRQVRHRSAIHLGFHSFLPGPGCSTITLLSTSTIPTLTSRNPKTTEHPPIPDSIIRPRLPYPSSLPSNVADLFSTYIFISDLPGTKSLP
jgi:hypothetical protein